MKKHLTFAAAALFAMTLFSPLFSGTLHAQEQGSADVQAGVSSEDQNSSQAQPSVGRISVIRGNVSIQRGDSGDWVAATVNTPIESGDRISTGDDSRAEIQLDYANVVRLDQNSTIKIADLTADHIQLQVGQGVVSYSVFPNGKADAEIDTPNSAVHPLRTGEYRIQIDNDSQTEVTVREGEAEVSEPQGSTRVDAGQIITIQGTDNPQYQTANAAPSDDFDRWSEDRDHTIQSAQSWNHDDRYYTGSEDLDHYGHWENVPDYGQVWVPAQDSGWAPYRDGRWVWEPYYGWTWVSYEPWGWAPYHYGRWFTYGGDWVWWPGPVGVYGGWGYYPVWSPAYVSFFGWGGGVSFGFGFGNVGWLPCGPGDFFNPWWGFGVSRVTFINVVNINNFDRDDFRFGHDRFGRGVGDRDWGRRMDPLFRGRNGFSNIGRFANDARIRNGVSSVRGDQFGRGDARFQRGLGKQEFQKASFMTGKLPAVPNRQSLGRVQDRVSPGIARTSAANNQRFFSQSRPQFTPRPFNTSAAAQQRIVENSRMQAGAANGRFGTSANGREGVTSGGKPFQQNSRVPMNETTRPGVATRGNAPAPSTEQTRPGVATRGNAQPQTEQTRSGWHSFGGNGNGNARVQGQPQGQGNFPNRGIQQPRGNQPQAQPRSFQPQSRQPESRPNGNFRPFTPPNNSGARQPMNQPRGNPGPAQPRSFQPPTRQPDSRPNGNFRPFTPPNNGGARQPMNQPRENQAQPRSFQQQNPSRPNGNGSSWRQFTPQQSPSGGMRENSRPENSRPQLNMRQPIAQPRGAYNGGRGPYGGNSGDYGRAAENPRSMGGDRPSYSPPPSRSYGSYGGGRPSYNPPSRSYGGGGYSAPRGESRPSYGGGGGRPSYGGGGGGGRSYSGGGGGGSRGGGGGGGSRGSGGGGSRGGGGGHPGRPH